MAEHVGACEWYGSASASENHRQGEEEKKVHTNASQYLNERQNNRSPRKVDWKRAKREQQFQQQTPPPCVGSNHEPPD